MVGRIKLVRAAASAVVAGGLCGIAWAGTLPGAPPRVAAPCSPDGVCLPRYDTWGFYETRWRPFPGDVVGPAPTDAETPGGEEEDTETMGGPLTPPATEESRLGPDRRPGAVPSGGDAVPADDMLPPGDGAPGGAILPEGDGSLPGGDGLLPEGGGLLPGGDGLGAPGDPLGGAIPLGSNGVPTPPAWLLEQADTGSFPAATVRVEPPASVAPRAVPVTHMPAPAVRQGPPAAAAPNLRGDDVPPSLPRSLQSRIGVAASPVLPASATSPVELRQPTSIRPTTAATIDAQVTPAGANMPLGIQLINPASAVMTSDELGGPQQAIYYEATDDAPAAMATDQ